MRVVQVAPSVTQKASGVSYSVPSLCRAVARTGADVTLHVLAPPPGIDLSPAALVVHPVAGVLPRLSFSASMRRSLAAEARTAEILHTHSLWMMPNLYPAWAVEGTRCRLVTSPRGTLWPQALRHHRWRKRAMWLALQRRAIRRSDCFHATSQAEVDVLRRAGLGAPAAVIPNGVDIPVAEDRPSVRDAHRRLLFLGRLHPLKGVDILLHAWQRVQGEFPEWELFICGPPDAPGYAETMKRLASTIGAERVEFAGLVQGNEKADMYRSSEILVQPTRGENFGMTVAEALSYGLPAIVSKGAPWSELESRGCGWWVDKGEGPLAECLRGALALSQQDLRDRGAKGRDWVSRDMSWARVGAMMRETYDWLVGGGSPPGWVQS
ncbi:MAG: glycosyltransferase [Planctomycetota bacterium]|nr:glycosyltransferase [Planctomycetota bacterium]